MKQMFVRIKETVAEKLRGLCAGLSPEKRMLTVIVLAVLFARKFLSDFPRHL